MGTVVRDFRRIQRRSQVGRCSCRLIGGFASGKPRWFEEARKRMFEAQGQAMLVFDSVKLNIWMVVLT